MALVNVCVCVASVICYMLNVLCVWPVIINGFGMCYMLNVCVCGQ